MKELLLYDGASTGSRRSGNGLRNDETGDGYLIVIHFKLPAALVAAAILSKRFHTNMVQFLSAVEERIHVVVAPRFTFAVEGRTSDFVVQDAPMENCV